ncbi:MAG: transcription antitermination factor NusB [Candidatus Saccharibacteria bacterium]|nr:transcription antitermination factor NusB [Candidatus Saccharibacteria bacterium]
MASNRHLGRIIALQTLYEVDFRLSCEDKAVTLDEVYDRNLGRYEKTVKDKAFVKRLVYGVHKKRDDLDKLIQPIAPEWPLSQIARVDLEILRLALYELTEMDDVAPPKVVINEAVELAKAFGSDNSSRFINGVLGTAYRTLISEEEKKK